MDRLIVGTYAFLTKIHLLELKERLELPFEYVRAVYDRLEIEYDERTTIVVDQDGLTYVDTTDTTRTPEQWHAVLETEVLHKLIVNDEEAFFKSVLLSKPPAIILLTSKRGEDAFERYDRTHDYTIKTRFARKHYGDGLVVYEGLTLKGRKRRELIETQLFFADYQQLARHLISHNQDIWKKVSQTRTRESFRFKEIPLMVNELIEDQRMISTAMQNIDLINDFLSRRESTCTIKRELEALKLYDFEELKVLTRYVKSEYWATREHIASTITLTEDLYKENEQKELNILQVIFAVGTISTIVSLGAMPGAKLFLTITGNQASGEIIAFNTPDLIFWTAISIVIGIALFVLLNYFFLSAKKLRLVSLIKRDR